MGEKIEDMCGGDNLVVVFRGLLYICLKICSKYDRTIRSTYMYAGEIRLRVCFLDAFGTWVEKDWWVKPSHAFIAVAGVAYRVRA